MKSIELTAYAVREYDVKYTIILDESDPIIKEYLAQNELEFDDLDRLDYPDYRDIWDTIMSLPVSNVKVDEDFGMGDERLIDFESFISEN